MDVPNPAHDGTESMKLKCQPEDFVVTEQLELIPTSGPYGLYRLCKTDIGTAEAIQHLRRTWNLAANQVAHAGLKDRHAVTRQTITIRNGPQADLTADRFRLEYVGQTNEPVTAAHIRCNEFQIVVRDLSTPAADRIERLTASSRTFTVPNYFDQQRFGSLGYSGEFVAVAWCRRDYERATWLALADANARDRSAEKGQKEILRDNWGKWTECKNELERSHRRSIVTYLVDHPVGFRKAFALINPDLRGLYLSAFQSAVWNRMLSQLVVQHHSDLPRLRIGDAELPFGRIESDMTQQQMESMPLVSVRNRRLLPDVENLAETALIHYGMKRREMKVSFPRDRFFSKADRSCWLRPDCLQTSVGDDELHNGSKKVTVSFELTSGSYATMVLKGLTAVDQELDA